MSRGCEAPAASELHLLHVIICAAWVLLQSTWGDSCGGMRAAVRAIREVAEVAIGRDSRSSVRKGHISVRRVSCLPWCIGTTSCVMCQAQACCRRTERSRRTRLVAKLFAWSGAAQLASQNLLAAEAKLVCCGNHALQRTRWCFFACLPWTGTGIGSMCRGWQTCRWAPHMAMRSVCSVLVCVAC